jgi:hypothetical protein
VTEVVGESAVTSTRKIALMMRIPGGRNRLLGERSGLSAGKMPWATPSRRESESSIAIWTKTISHGGNWAPEHDMTSTRTVMINPGGVAEVLAAAVIFVV